MHVGGLFGASKYSILQSFPKNHIPYTIFCHAAETDNLAEQLVNSHIDYPVVLKPDVGERGFLVEKINTQKELQQYIQNVKVDIIAQEFVNIPEEISVLYYRLPNETRGQITSITLKENLHVIGDGLSTVEELMFQSARTKMQIKRFRKSKATILRKIPAKEERITLEPIGNHNRGTKFINGNYLINNQLRETFDQLCIQTNGFYYGRFDIKCQSFEALCAGHFTILEVNGIASEPTHIYDPEYSFFTAVKDFYSHWKIIANISRIQSRKGIRPMGIVDVLSRFHRYKKYIRDNKQ